MSELKPCPFCGGKGVVCKDEWKWFYIQCANSKCKVRGQIEIIEAKALAAWNTRTDGWIRVEDGLPEDRESVWAYGVLTSRGVMGMAEARDTYSAYYNTEYKQWVLRDENHTIDDVTHWQPMSAPPKEKEE